MSHLVVRETFSLFFLQKVTGTEPVTERGENEEEEEEEEKKTEEQVLEDEAREETARLCSVWENEYFANETFVVGYKDTSPVR